MRGLGGGAGLLFVKHRMKPGERNEDKAILKRSIGEISTLSKHFHFQSCLWP